MEAKVFERHVQADTEPAGEVVAWDEMGDGTVEIGSLEKGCRRKRFSFREDGMGGDELLRNRKEQATAGLAASAVGAVNRAKLAGGSGGRQHKEQQGANGEEFHYELSLYQAPAQFKRISN